MSVYPRKRRTSGHFAFVPKGDVRGIVRYLVLVGRVILEPLEAQRVRHDRSRKHKAFNLFTLDEIDLGARTEALSCTTKWRLRDLAGLLGVEQDARKRSTFVL